MIEPPVPANEPQRLSALHGLNVLDTPPEESFDRVTRLARRLFGVQTVLVSLVDENRQWFKSRQGLDAPETARDISFCGHAILDRDVMVVADAREDERFRDNPLVTGEPWIRFYAGCPLTVSDGCTLGTLCLIDPHPRTMTVEELELLMDLAAMLEESLAAMDLATTDELTGLSNRRGFMLLAGKALSTSRRLGRPATVLVFDLNDFKSINDRFGHAAGDEALRAFASALVSTFRDCDVVARTGGDEFCVFLGGAEARILPDLLSRLARRLRSEGAPARRDFQLSYSVGSCTRAADYDCTLDHLLREADARMYENKRRMKSRAARVLSFPQDTARPAARD